MIKKGIVLEINKNNVVVLTCDGEFLQLRINNIIPVLGEEYYGTPYHKINFIKPMLTAACILFIFNIAIVYRTYFQVYNTVDISINPSVRLYTNRKNKIIKVEGTNEDGILLLAKSKNIKGEECETGIIDIIKGALELHYLTPENTSVKIHSEKDNVLNYNIINSMLKQVENTPNENQVDTVPKKDFNEKDVIIETTKKPNNSSNTNGSQSDKKETDKHDDDDNDTDDNHDNDDNNNDIHDHTKDDSDDDSDDDDAIDDDEDD